MHSFTTERLLIRPLAEQDKSMYITLFCNAKTMQYIGEPLTEEAATQAFNRTLKAMKKEKPKVMTWAIITLNDNQSVGLQALNWQKSSINGENQKEGFAEAGIMLLPSSHGELIPKEAISAMIEYAFNCLPITRINAIYVKKNIAVARITKSLGFNIDSSIQQLDESQGIQYINKPSWHSCF